MYQNRMKRVLACVLSLAGIIILSWLFLIISIAIVIDDPGPVFFKQDRIGIHKKHFKILKFRSMKMSTPKDVPTHLLKEPDQYITRVGHFLRKTSLDELPQFFNIFKGDMAIVGPRPALWNQYDLIEERDRYGANDVRPGLTGWAQIHGRDELEIAEKAWLDGYYVEHLSFFMDARCFFGSVTSVLRKDGVIEGGTGEMCRHETKRRIAVISSHTPSLFWFRMDMMHSFQEFGYQVYAVGNEDEAIWEEKFKQNGIIYQKIDVQRNGVNPVRDIKTLNCVKRVLKEIRPHKVFVYQAKTIIYTGMAANRLGITEVYPLIAGIGSLYLKNDLKTKLVRRMMNMEYRIALKKCPSVFFQNRDDEHVFRNNHILKDQTVVMIPGSGVNMEDFQVQPFPETVSFLCISRLIRDKGVYEYLEASRRMKEMYPQVHFRLVGPFDSNPSAIQPQELQAFIDEGSIEYYGEQEDVRPFIAQSTVFVLVSYREGTPKTNLEAMACGRPVITTDAPGCRETVTDGENGFLIPVKDVEALCEKMSYFIDHPEMIPVMGSKGRRKAEDRFDVTIVNRIICQTMKLQHN